MINITRKAKRIWKKSRPTLYDCRQMLSFLGWIDCTDTYGMYTKWVRPYVAIHEMKRRVRMSQKLCSLG